MIHPRVEVLPEWINYLDTFNNRENMISASTRYANGYKDSNPIVYSLRAVRRHYRRNKVVVTGIDDQWDADLMDMTKF